MLEIENLNQYYSGSHILRNVQMFVPMGQLTVLLGRNGVGKTTLLKCLMGAVAVRSGDIRWQGKSLNGLKPHARVAAGLAYVPQGREIFPRPGVAETLLVGAASRKGLRGSPEHIYGLVPVLREVRGRRGGDLAGGQQQQRAIGRALMSEASVLSLDEPTEGIHPSVITEIGRRL